MSCTTEDPFHYVGTPVEQDPLIANYLADIMYSDENDDASKELIQKMLLEQDLEEISLSEAAESARVQQLATVWNEFQALPVNPIEQNTQNPGQSYCELVSELQVFQWIERIREILILWQESDSRQ